MSNPAKKQKQHYLGYPVPPTLAQVLDLWNAKNDTLWIARRFNVHEAVIYNMLARFDTRINAERRQ